MQSLEAQVLSTGEKCLEEAFPPHFLENYACVVLHMLEKEHSRPSELPPWTAG